MTNLDAVPGYGQVCVSGDRAWSVPELIEVASGLPVEDVPLESFAELDIVVWSSQPMTVREVADHVRRIYEADLSCPVIVSAEGWIMDGCHRLARAYLEGAKTILARRFVVDPDSITSEP